MEVGRTSRTTRRSADQVIGLGTLLYRWLLAELEHEEVDRAVRRDHMTFWAACAADTGPDAAQIGNRHLACPADHGCRRLSRSRRHRLRLEQAAGACCQKTPSTASVWQSASDRTGAALDGGTGRRRGPARPMAGDAPVATSGLAKSPLDHAACGREPVPPGRRSTGGPRRPLNPKGTDMNMHPDLAAMVGRQQYRDMLAAAEQARLVRQAVLFSPAKPRRVSDPVGARPRQREIRSCECPAPCQRSVS